MTTAKPCEISCTSWRWPTDDGPCSCGNRGASTPVRMTLVDAKEWTGGDGLLYRREEWTIRGGEVDPAWLTDADQRARVAGWEPSSRFTLYVVDGQVDRRVASYGGAVWPVAWWKLFAKGRRASVEITDEGLLLRAAALDGASDMHADARLLP